MKQKWLKNESNFSSVSTFDCSCNLFIKIKKRLKEQPKVLKKEILAHSLTNDVSLCIYYIYIYIYTYKDYIYMIRNPNNEQKTTRCS